MDAAHLDLEDLPPKALRKLIKSMLAKAGKRTEESDSKDDEEREALADMHESHKGKSKHVPVTKEDLPFDLENHAESDDASEEKEAKQEASKKHPPRKKKGH